MLELRGFGTEPRHETDQSVVAGVAAGCNAEIRREVAREVLLALIEVGPCPVYDEVTPHQVPFKSDVARRVPIQRGPQWVPEHYVESGAEDGHRHVGEAVDDALHPGSDVVRNHVRRRRRGSGGAVKVIALVVGEAQRDRESPQQLTRGVQCSSLFEAHDVIDADTREGGEFFTSEADGAPSGTGGETDITGSQPVAPRPQHTGELCHATILQRRSRRGVVLTVPLSQKAWVTRSPGHRMDGMTTTLITGANKGLGLETARRLINAGHTVYAGMRDLAAGDAVRALGARPLQLDVTDQAGVEAVLDSLPELDVLVNNAGIRGTSFGVDDLTPEAMRSVLDTNVLGIVRVTQAALPLLRRSSHPVIVNVASGVGWPRFLSTEGRDEFPVPAIPYAASKAAVIALTVQYAKNLPSFRVNASDPGYTATESNGYSGHQTVAEGTDATVALALVAPDGPTGEFHNRNGRIDY
jgi:NAD(P)-dependent dehydrogenase (short-subunit alcohol dehydrogenase family)